MRLRRSKRFRFGIATVVIGLAVWASGVRLFAFPGESMAPAVEPGDYFVALVGPWRWRTPDRFDLVIYDVPPDSKWAVRNVPWMKRVVGLPGEHVRLSGNRLFVNGQLIPAPFLHRDGQTAPNDYEITLRPGEYFTLGDNLDHSFDDSRSMGPIDAHLMRGVVGFVFHRKPR